MTETHRPTEATPLWVKVVATALAIPVIGIIVGALVGALGLVWRWAL